jgi:hypothetical protein
MSLQKGYKHLVFKSLPISCDRGACNKHLSEHFPLSVMQSGTSQIPEFLRAREVKRGQYPFALSADASTVSTEMNRPAIILSLSLFTALFVTPVMRAENSKGGDGVLWSRPSHSLALFGRRAPLTFIKYDRRMIRAAEIAASRACRKPTLRCWHFVKDALLDAGVVAKRPESPWAKQAGEELCSKFGFRKLPVTDPRDAPVGSVIVYGGADAGHVELRTDSGYASDFISRTPYPRRTPRVVRESCRAV